MIKEITDFYYNTDHWIINIDGQNNLNIQIDGHNTNEKNIPYIDFTNSITMGYRTVKNIIYNNQKYFELYNVKGLVKTLTITDNIVEINFVQSERKFKMPFDELYDILKQYVDNYFMINMLNKKEPICGLADPDGDYYDEWKLWKYHKAEM